MNQVELSRVESILNQVELSRIKFSRVKSNLNLSQVELNQESNLNQVELNLSQIELSLES